MPDQEILKLSFGQETAEHLRNQEVANLIDMMDDALRQVTACPSAHVRNWQGADLVIVRDMYTRISQQVELFSADPQQYFPNADKTTMNIPGPPEIQQPENQGALIIARQMARLRMQLRNGSSGQQVSGFHPKELELVIKPSVTKLGRYIEMEEQRFDQGQSDFLPDVDDQSADETTPGSPDNE